MAKIPKKLIPPKKPIIPPIVDTTHDHSHEDPIANKKSYADLFPDRTAGDTTAKQKVTIIYRENKGPVPVEPAAYKRMDIVIEGVAERTVSAVDSLVAELKASGVKDEIIKQRVMDEIQQGRVLPELRAFAQARIPGFTGEMIQTFARDTLSAKQRALEAIASYHNDKNNNQTVGDTTAVLDKRSDIETAMRDNMQEAIDTATTPEEQERAQAILDIFENSGIDVTNFEGNELPGPPDTADESEEFMWVAVEDKATCEFCSDQHGDVNSLYDWIEIGLPRSGNCAGDFNCRCVLVPTNSLTSSDQTQLKDNGPLNVPTPK